MNHFNEVIIPNMYKLGYWPGEQYPRGVASHSLREDPISMIFQSPPCQRALIELTLFGGSVPLETAQ